MYEDNMFGFAGFNTQAQPEAPFYYGGGNPFMQQNPFCQNQFGMPTDSRRNLPMQGGTNPFAQQAPVTPVAGQMGFNQMVDSRRTATTNVQNNPWATPQATAQVQPVAPAPIAPMYGTTPETNMFCQYPQTMNQMFNPFVSTYDPDLTNSKNWWRTAQQSQVQPYFAMPTIAWPQANAMPQMNQPQPQYPMPQYPTVKQDWKEMADRIWGSGTL